MASASLAKPKEKQPKPSQAVVALTEEGNLNVDVAGKTPLSDWRRIDR
jgi:hypothetical protein